MFDLKTKAREVNELGYCLLPSVFSADECTDMERLLRGVWEQRGRPKLEGFGIGIHPLLEHAPDMAPYYAHPAVLEVLSEIFADDVHLTHTGARISNEESAPAIGWHEHYAWPTERIPAQPPGALLFGCYVQGLSAETGPLIVMPRRVNEPLAPPPGEPTANWPGQVAVLAPPGSVVIFDTALYHTAHRGTKPGFRYLCGAHCQGWRNTEPHREDNGTKQPAVEEHKRRNARLRKMIDGL